MHNKRRWSGAYCYIQKAKCCQEQKWGNKKIALHSQVVFNLFIGIGLQRTALIISLYQKDMLKLIVMHQPPKDQKILQGGMLAQCDHARVYYMKVRELPQFFITDDFSSVFGFIVTERDVWGMLWRGFHRSTKLFEASPRPLTVPLGFSLPVLPGSSSGPAWRRRAESAGNAVLRILQTFTWNACRAVQSKS